MAIVNPQRTRVASGLRGPGRVAALLLGVAAIIVGVVLLANMVTAVRALVLLIAAALVLEGLLEILLAPSFGRRWVSVLVGALLVAGGLVAVAWPRITLWVLALVVGADLVVSGAIRLTVAVRYRAALPGWAWLALAGALSILVGLLALAWPRATVLVLALLLGAHVLFYGIALLFAAFASGGSGSGRGGAVAPAD